MFQKEVSAMEAGRRLGCAGGGWLRGSEGRYLEMRRSGNWESKGLVGDPWGGLSTKIMAGVGEVAKKVPQVYKLGWMTALWR